MTDTNENGEGPVSEVEEHIMDGVVLVATGRSGGKAKVTVYYTGGEKRQPIYSDKHPKEFYSSHTARGEIRKGVTDALEDTPLDADAWEQAWKEWYTGVLENEDDASLEVVHESVRGLAEGTQEVRNGKTGGNRVWDIDLEWNGEEGTLRFDAEDMAKGGVTSLKTQLFTEFGNCPPGIENEEWESLKAYWLDIQTEAYEEHVTERDRAKEMFLSKLRERVTAYDSAEALERDKQSVWVDEGNSYGIEINGLAGDVDAVVWVRSDLVNTILSEMDSAPDIGELAGELQKPPEYYCVRGSANRKPTSEMAQRRYWFFDRDALGITTVHEWDESDGETGVVDP